MSIRVSLLDEFIAFWNETLHIYSDYNITFWLYFGCSDFVANGAVMEEKYQHA